jgi:hypothetical protein
VGRSGAVGPTGFPGGQGPRGYQGNTGPSGPRGPQGNAPIGPQGYTGPTGYQGPQGPRGYQGPQGPTGPQGNVGPQGFAGPPGPVSCTLFSTDAGATCFQACNSFMASCSGYYQTWATGYYLYDGNYQCQNSLQSWFCTYQYLSWNGSCWVVSAGGYISSSSTCSDRKIKEEIETIEDGLKLLLQLEPVEFDWNETFYQIKAGFPKDKKHTIGFIAQEVEKILPEVVEIDLENGYYKINYPKLNAIVVEGIKQQQLFIEDINNKINDLEKLLN